MAARTQLIRVAVEDAAQNAQPPVWVIDKLFISGGVYLLAGQAKKGKKSLIALSMAAAVASGTSFLGRKCNKRSVCYVALEDGPDRTGWRAKQMGLDTPRWPPGAFQFSFGVEGAREMMNMLHAGLRDTFIIIDPLVNFLALYDGLDENSAKDMTLVLRQLQELCRKQNCTILIIHHFNKGREAMRGSTALEASCDGWGESRPTKDSSVVNLVWTLRDGHDIVAHIKVTTDDQEHLILTEVDGAEIDGLQEAQVEALVLENALGIPAGYRTSRKGVYDALKERKGKKITRKAIYDAIDRLVAQGKVRSSSNGIEVDPTHRELLKVRAQGGSDEWN